MALFSILLFFKNLLEIRLKVFPYHDRDYLPHSVGLYTLANNLLRFDGFLGCSAAISAFSTAKANTEFELKFTAPGALLLGVAESIANQNAVYV